ncbi:hypothetical protein [Streptomyces sp. NBC_00690]|uniref:hypothetical protein n=1 Tax=Streptomyces sp. NBC_00690 TaxID=2975808 RepID=UPI002E2DA558|nr:hypothetical protein [Streptomyces sp. NBC_00690]
MRHLRQPFRLVTAVTLVVALAACGSSGEEGEQEGDQVKAPGGERKPAVEANTSGCPDPKLLEPILGSPAFSLSAHGDWHDGGWHCGYEPAARHPLGHRLDVYTERDGYQAGAPGSPADGYGALPDVGRQASFRTSCPGDPGTGRLSAGFARKGGQEANTQELVFMASGDVINDCDKQRELIRSLARVFYDHQIGKPSG